MKQEISNELIKFVLDDGRYWRQGQENPRAESTYTSYNWKAPYGFHPKDEDDSYFFNEINYENVTFVSSSISICAHNS